ncbi:MAG: MBL fold metallo-hydrolase [Kiritimatiellae bacterium]|nr:MBL fold metallo-hydrolase [Kiritimatiellia bacterium]
MKLRITTLVEDTAGGRGLLAEHGLAFWIELGARKIFFDTGQGLVLPSNACQLNILREEAGDVIISHGHYDHTGGLGEILRLAGKRRVYMHPAALMPKYARNTDNSSRAIGLPPPLNEKQIRVRSELVFTEKPVEIGEGLFLTGPVPRQNDFEDVGGPYFTDPACLQPDALADDQSAFIDTPDGTVVILGCAHAGVVNTLNYIRELTGHHRIHTVLGGMHLLSAGPKRMARTLAEFRRLDIKRLIPCHCTGFAATAQLRHEFRDKCAPCPVGTVLDWSQ